MRAVLFCSAAFAVLVGVLSGPAAAKSPDGYLEEFVIYTWSVQDGLPQSSVTDAVQDEDGFFWFGTFGGLVRFDGVKFQKYGPNRDGAFPSELIDRVWKGPEGRLWIATREQLVWREGQRFVRGPKSIRSATSFAVDARGRVILTTRSNEVFAFEGLEPQRLPTPESTCEAERVDTITLVGASDGAVYAERCDSVLRLEGDDWVAVLGRADWPEREPVIEGFARREAGGLWIVTTEAVYAYDGALQRRYGRADRGGGNYVRVEDLGDDGLWTASLAYGATRYRPGARPLRLDERRKLPHDAVRFVVRGRESHLWIGTDGGGLVQLRRTPVRTLSAKDGLGERIVRQTLAGPDGKLWIATHGDGLWSFDGQRLEGPIATHPELKTAWVWALHFDVDGQLWAGFLEDGASRVTPRPSPLELGEPAIVHAISDDPDGGLLFGTTDGLFRYDPIRGGAFAGTTVTGTVTALRRDGPVVWAGTSDGRVLKKRAGGGWEQAGLPSRRPTNDGIYSIRIDPVGQPWVVGDRRLEVLTADGWRRIERRDGLGEFTPTDIGFDRQGGAWVTGKQGILRFDRTELLEAATGGAPARQGLLNGSDGLRSVEVNHVERWVRDGREILVFSTLDGIAFIDPATVMLPSEPPRARIDFLRYHVDSDELPSPIAGLRHSTIESPTEKIDLPPNSDHVVVGLSGPSFADPEAVRFLFALEGPNGVYRGETYDRALTLHSPRVGSYRLEVEAETHHGKRSEAPAILEFTISPTLMETAWFVPGIAGLATIGFITFFGLRSSTLRRAAERERGLRQSEQRFRQLERKLMETQRLESLGLLAGGVAHDFNNLLTGILANAELLRSSTADSEESEMVEGIIVAGRRAAELCGQMLAYSGRGRMIVETIDLNRVTAETIRLVKRSVSPDVHFESVLEPGVLAVDADAAQIRQVIMNLLTNASEALPEPRGQIRVHTSRRPGLSRRRLESAVIAPENPDQPFCCIEVVDEGVGMDDETVHRIFEPFFTTKATGRGLGLAATLGIVQGHGGSLFVDTKAGVGSRFMLCLPASASTPAPESNEDITPSTGLSVRRIMVVDDEEAIRRTIQRTFRRMNFVVLEAGSGPEALDLTRRVGGAFDLVFLDLTMPEMDGAEVLQRFRKLAPDVPVILMSGYAKQDVLDRVGETTRISFLQKPFGIQDLVRATNQAVPPTLEDLVNQPS